MKSCTDDLSDTALINVVSTSNMHLILVPIMAL